MSIINIKCPNCGGYVEFDPASQRYKCPYCGQILLERELKEAGVQTEMPEDETPAQEESAGRDEYKSYHCRNCGAQIVTGATTAASRCYYCHNPVVLNDRLDGEFRPDGVIPFKLDKRGAEEAFKKFIASKKYVDHEFYSDAQLKEFTGVYYPYWYGDIQGKATFDGEGTRVSVQHFPQYIVTTTRHFRVMREGRLTFRNMFRKALKAADRTLSEGIHPYSANVQEFKPGYLSGFMAEMRDIPEEEVRAEMEAEASGIAPSLIKKDHPYNSLTGNASFQVEKQDMRYVLLPAWVLTWKNNKTDEMYYYMMNGETGQVCGKLPVDKKKLLLTALGAGIAVFAALCAGGALLW